MKPDDNETTNELVRLYLKDKRFKDAIKIYKKIIKKNPKNLEIALKLGFLYAFF